MKLYDNKDRVLVRALWEKLSSEPPTETRPMEEETPSKEVLPLETLPPAALFMCLNEDCEYEGRTKRAVKIHMTKEHKKSRKPKAAVTRDRGGSNS